jgi:predicted transcriptional regulator
MKDKTKDKLFTVRLDADTFENLEKIGKRDDRTMAYLVRKAIEEFIKREK